MSLSQSSNKKGEGAASAAPLFTVFSTLSTRACAYAWKKSCLEGYHSTPPLGLGPSTTNARVYKTEGPQGAHKVLDLGRPGHT